MQRKGFDLVGLRLQRGGGGGRQRSEPTVKADWPPSAPRWLAFFFPPSLSPFRAGRRRGDELPNQSAGPRPDVLIGPLLSH